MQGIAVCQPYRFHHIGTIIAHVISLLSAARQQSIRLMSSSIAIALHTSAVLQLLLMDGNMSRLVIIGIYEVSRNSKKRTVKANSCYFVRIIEHVLQSKSHLPCQFQVSVHLQFQFDIFNSSQKSSTFSFRSVKYHCPSIVAIEVQGVYICSIASAVRLLHLTVYVGMNSFACCFKILYLINYSFIHLTQHQLLLLLLVHAGINCTVVEIFLLACAEDDLID